MTVFSNDDSRIPKQQFRQFHEFSRADWNYRASYRAYEICCCTLDTGAVDYTCSATDKIIYSANEIVLRASVRGNWRWRCRTSILDPKETGNRFDSFKRAARSTLYRLSFLRSRVPEKLITRFGFSRLSKRTKIASLVRSVVRVHPYYTIRVNEYEGSLARPIEFSTSEN